MAIMYPKNINEYMPTDSERIVYYVLKNQLPDNYEVFYSVKWTTYEEGSLVKSEADFIVTCPEYGFICLEVKGGTEIHRDGDSWSVEDTFHGERELTISPYDQAEKSMYYFYNTFSNKYNFKYNGIYGAGTVFPFYAIGEEHNLDNKHRKCTIDCNDMNDIYSKIKAMFKLWGGKTYGRNFYPISQHNALIELIRERIAISAAAGSLVKYKGQQLETINRVQDNYVYFLSNVRQFYIRGGAGTGKTWIAMKMALQEAQKSNSKVLFVCASENLSKMVASLIGAEVDVMDINTLFNNVITDYSAYQAPLYYGLSNAIKCDIMRYDSIFVDEAQDFCFEWAKTVRKLLVDHDSSRMGVFYDDVQVLRADSFGDGFEIAGLPFLLHENIRNTANIYNWTAAKTNLGTDVIANPVEGPTPQTEFINELGQLTVTLETLFKRYLCDEYLPNDSMTILTDDVDYILSQYCDGIAKWKIVHSKTSSANEISVFSVEEYKGLETNMAIYIHTPKTSDNVNYIAYTRAKYYLIELVRNY